MSMHVLTKDAHVNRSYARTNARIELKFVLIEFTYVDILSLKFEKDPFRRFGEINVLPSLYVSMRHFFKRWMD